MKLDLVDLRCVHARDLFCVVRQVQLLRAFTASENVSQRRNFVAFFTVGVASLFVRFRIELCKKYRKKQLLAFKAIFVD